MLKGVPAAIVPSFPVAALAEEATTYTLYRNSVIPHMRIHVATFDSDEGQEYNHENCLIGAEMFQAQAGVSVRYWCERGSYKK